MRRNTVVLQTIQEMELVPDGSYGTRPPETPVMCSDGTSFLSTQQIAGSGKQRANQHTARWTDISLKPLTTFSLVC